MAEQEGSFSDALPSIIAGAAEGLKEVAREIMDYSRVLCPKDTETLVNSAFTTEPEQYGDRMVIVIGYGRGEAINPKTGDHPSKYAVPVHEILEAKHAPPTQAKFLEVPCLEYEPKMGETMRVWISRFTKGEGVATGSSSAGLIASSRRIV